jgi:DNA-binding response OmpR family regulator
VNKIVIIDDQEDILWILKSILSKKGYEVKTDSTGAFLDKLDKEQPDLVILDFYFGQQKGSDICQKLKDSLKTKHIPIILMSAMPNLSKTSRDSGADDYLPKPFQISDLIKKVEQNLQAA